MVAAEQMLGISRLLLMRGSIFSLMPLARSVFEHGSAVVWIFDRSASPDTLFARAALAEEADAARACDLAVTMAGKGSADHVSARNHLKAVRAGLDLFGEVDLRGPVRVNGEQWLSPTALVEAGVRTLPADYHDIEQWQGAYAILCGVGNHVSLMPWGYTTMPTELPGKIEPNIQIDQIDPIVRMVVLLGAGGMLKYGTFLGWSKDDLRQLIGERLITVIGPTPVT